MFKEQELNVDLAARHGMGLAMAIRHADSPRMTDAVRRVASDPGFASNARRVQGWYAGIDGAARAAYQEAERLEGLADPAKVSSP